MSLCRLKCTTVCHLPGETQEFWDRIYFESEGLRALEAGEGKTKRGRLSLEGYS